ncbi:DUF4254 domain-containing protein [bacterium]|nr:DUF4254 domain-containing protein [bacterium]MBU1752732.1 DUF4254 domain-containing protein [bacterium]
MIKFDVDFMKNLQSHCITMLHEDEGCEVKLIENYQDIYQLICTLQLHNYYLWHQEDIARRVDVNDTVIAETKHRIDRLNHSRNDTIEKIDEYLLLSMQGDNIDNSLPINSETPGSIIDRMSILTLKIYHMNEETKRNDVSLEHIEKCQDKLIILKEQLEDLGNCLKVLLEEIFNGKKRLKIYRQFKMYNDPALNPQLYARQAVTE